MIELINNFKTSIEENNGSVMVLYNHGPLTGYCEYKRIEVNNRFKQQGPAVVQANPRLGVVELFVGNAFSYVGRPLSRCLK